VSETREKTRTREKGKRATCRCASTGFTCASLMPRGQPRQAQTSPDKPRARVPKYKRPCQPIVRCARACARVRDFLLRVDRSALPLYYRPSSASMSASSPRLLVFPLIAISVPRINRGIRCTDIAYTQLGFRFAFSIEDDSRERNFAANRGKIPTAKQFLAGGFENDDDNAEGGTSFEQRRVHRSPSVASLEMFERR